MRGQVLGNFSLYDYKLPLDLSPELHHSFQVVVADPPYLVCPAGLRVQGLAFHNSKPCMPHRIQGAQDGSAATGARTHSMRC